MADICLWGSTVDAAQRRWYTCDQPPAPDRQLCALHVGVANRRKRRRAKNKRRKQAARSNR